MGRLNPSGQVAALHLEYDVPLSIPDCLQRLKGRNIYDVFKYEVFDIQEKTCTLVFTEALTHMCHNIHTQYNVEFQVVSKNQTKMKLDFVSDGIIPSLPCVPELWINEFFQIKMDATQDENGTVAGEWKRPTSFLGRHFFKQRNN